MVSDQAENKCIVVVGASAGGIDALARLVGALAENFPAPIVVAQHADPKGAGRLGEILQRQTRLKIHMVADGDGELEAGWIYLASPGQNLAIENGRVLSVARQPGHPVPSIDGLFESAAHAYGDHVIGVILTGMGTDGVAGVRRIKEFGGTVVVQEAESAAYPALPRAIPTNYVDFTSRIEEIAGLLGVLAAPGDGNIFDSQSVEVLLGQVRTRSGIDFRQYKPATIRRRLMRLIAAANAKSVADYMRHLNTHPEAYQQLVSSFLIKVTGFFRDPALFEYLRETVLPELIAEAREGQRELRLWSAGCSTGEEAYSLAILLAELLGNDVDKLPVRIFATDLDHHAIDFARRGVYPAAAFEELPPALIEKYFTRVDGAFQVRKDIRNLTVFGEYDLGQRAPFPHIDLIMCRNVLIYFTKELQQRTLQLFAFSLRQSGYLVLGKAETTSPLPRYFAAAQPALKVYRRQGERLMIPAPVALESLRHHDRPLRLGAIRPSHPRETTHEGMPPRWSMIDRLGAFLFESYIGIVVVDRHYDIVTINQAARTLLGVAGQGIGDDLIHIAQLPGLELKAQLDTAFRGAMPTAPFEVNLRDPGEIEQRCLQIACYPDRVASKEGRTEGVVVVIFDVTYQAKRRRELEKENAESRAAIEQLTRQTSELAGHQHALVQANEELSSANIDLRNTNEHLMIAAEEAEASAEEVETLNEEMQATSEELETLNEELHATVEELNTTNEELASRSSDLEQAVQEREKQLDHAVRTLGTLRAVVEHAPLIMCIVDKDSNVSLASKRYAEMVRHNGGALPAVGEKWLSRPEHVALRERDGAVDYAVRRISLPSDGGDTMVVLAPSS
ncbi:MAG TPA: CheR family methyltransferase [Candidatus Baltobacteraceae bacterium]|jgi:two-component system CheB/CheR fusion protein